MRKKNNFQVVGPKSNFAAIETWHEFDACPNLIACTLSGYISGEKACTRSGKAIINTKSNHDGMYLLQGMFHCSYLKVANV